MPPALSSPLRSVRMQVAEEEGGAPDNAAAPPVGDSDTVAALRRGDEAAFAALIARHHASMVRVARSSSPGPPRKRSPAAYQADWGTRWIDRGGATSMTDPSR